MMFFLSKIAIFKGSSSSKFAENHQKDQEKMHANLDWKEKSKNTLKNGFGTLFGRGLERSGPPFGRSWLPLGCFLDVHHRVFFTHWPKMGSKKPFGSIWGRFCIDFRWIFEGSGRVLGRFWIQTKKGWSDLGFKIQNPNPKSESQNSNPKASIPKPELSKPTNLPGATKLPNWTPSQPGQ